MFFARRTRRFTAWFACLAILLASLAPSISHALAAKTGIGAFWAEICSTAGIKKVAVAMLAGEDEPGPSSPADPGHHVEDCSYCRLQADMPVLPPAESMSLLVADLGLSLPILFYHSPRPLFAWASVHARAPPASSSLV